MKCGKKDLVLNQQHFLSWAGVNDPRIFRASSKLERLIVKKTTIENPISTQRSTPAANANAFLQTALSDLLRSQATATSHTRVYGAAPIEY